MNIVHITLFVVATLSIGSASILVRMSMASGTACAFWRLVFSSLLLLLILLSSKKLATEVHILVLDKVKFFKVFTAGVSLAFHFILWMESLFRIPIAVSVTLVVMYPIHLAIVELLKERNAAMIVNIMGLALGFIGVSILYKNALIMEKLDLVGIMQSFVASVFAAAYFYIGKLFRRYVGLYSYTFTVYSVAALIVLIYSIIIKDNIFVYLSRSWIWFLLLALIPMFGGHTVMNYMLKFYKSSSVTSIALAEPVIASILAVVILREQIEPLYIPSLMMILTGIAIVMLFEIKEAKCH